jgi:hypothetical protein
VVIGAELAPGPALVPLLGTLLAFFLAVGIAAHTLDELHGRPLRTTIPSKVLIGAAGVSLAGAATIGGFGVARVGVVLIPFIALGVFLVIAYNVELFGGAVHNDLVFSFAWGSFPLLTAYVAQAHTVSVAALVAAGAAFAFSYAQRALSTRARLVRRSIERVEGSVVTASGVRTIIDEVFLLQPLERALASLSWALVAMAAALAIDRMV